MRTGTWLAARILQTTAEDYRRQGFSVDPAPADSGTDFVAAIGDRIIYVQVKTISSSGSQVETASNLKPLPAGTNSRFDVVWQPTSELTAVESIRARLVDARQIVDAYPEAAFMLSLGALEAAALRLASTADQLPRSFVLADYVVALRDDGLIDTDQFAAIGRMLDKRNKLAHGRFDAQRITSVDTVEAIELASELVLSIPSRAAELLDQAVGAIEEEPLDDEFYAVLTRWLRVHPKLEYEDAMRYAQDRTTTLAKRRPD